MKITNIMYYLVFFTNEKDTGAYGKAYELAVREYLSGRKQKAVKSQGKTDAYFSFNVDGKKKTVTVEIKTACGEIDTADRSQFIIYCPEVQHTENAEDQGFVFTRSEWVDFVNGYKGRGQFIRVDSKRGKKHIQSFYTENRPKASKPIAHYIWDSCLSKPTVAEWKNQMRG